MMRKISIALYVSALVLVAASSDYARAQDSCELQLVGGAPLEFDEVGRPMVPATIEGRNKYILIDTGGFTNTLDLATAQELDLRTRNSRISIMGVTGESSSQSVTVSEYRIGNMNLAGHELMISPGDPGEVSDTRPVGTLVSGVFRTFDMELNFSENRMLLYSQDHCDGAFGQRFEAGTALAVIPFTLDESYHVGFPVTIVPVTIDGVEFDAILDTGAAYTTLSLPVAQQYLGVDRSWPDLQEVGTLDGRYAAAVYATSFDSLEIGGVVIPEPELVLLPDMISRYQYTSLGFQAPDSPSLPDVILGMSLLRFFHTYIAFGEQNLYLVLDRSSIARALGTEPNDPGQPPGNAQANDVLISAVDRALLEDILAAENYTIVGEQTGAIDVDHPTRPRLAIWLMNCGDDGQCSHLRLRGPIPIGGSAEAEIAAEEFDRMEPSASVTLSGPEDRRIVFVGRDVWVEPGVTRANIIAELERTASLTAAMMETVGALNAAP